MPESVVSVFLWRWLTELQALGFQEGFPLRCIIQSSLFVSKPCVTVSTAETQGSQLPLSLRFGGIVIDLDMDTASLDRTLTR